MASAACIKMAGVPVEFRVATIFEAMMALFPTPVTTTRPLESKMAWIVFGKSSSNWEIKLSTARPSISMVRLAMSSIALVSLKVIVLLGIAFQKECIIFKFVKLRKLTFIAYFKFHQNKISLFISQTSKKP
jgi:hypothetical protein